MNKNEIVAALFVHHENFIELIESLSAEQRALALPGKWNADQQVEHVIKSVAPVKLAFQLPFFVLAMAFGKANRASRSYENLVEKYKAKLAAGGKAPKRFVPSTKRQMPAQILRLRNLIKQLSQKIETMAEDKLDQFVLPHPLLGKLTLREMLFFTIYHVQHHQSQVANNIAAK
jgi:hypothetical protein